MLLCSWVAPSKPIQMFFASVIIFPITISAATPLILNALTALWGDNSSVLGFLLKSALSTSFIMFYVLLEDYK